MPKIIIANWKLNPATLAEAEELAKASDVEGLVICPPYPFLKAAAGVVKKSQLGAQDLFWEDKGAYTGEVSGSQLKDLGVKFVIIGHSERRQNLGETDEMVAKKIAATLQDGLIPILCVGETRAQRDAGETKEVVARELKTGLSLIGNCLPASEAGKLKTPNKNKFGTGQVKNLVVAYEPIWAIGTGTPDTPENMLEMIQYIEGIMNELGIMGTVVIYGGSVTSKNAESFLRHNEIGGALVGGASLNGEEIKAIVKIAEKYN